MSLLKRLIAVFAFIVSAGPANAGIPVVDSALNSQTMINATQTAASWVSQLQSMAQQYQQTVQQFNAVTGSRGMAALLQNAAAYSNLPPQFANLASQIKGTPGYQNLRQLLPNDANPKINAIYDAMTVKRAALSDAYSQASVRLDQIKQLQQSIDTAYDPAAKQDLQNRMLAELQSIQATNQLLNMMKPQQEADIQLANQAAVKSLICSEFNPRSTRCR